MAETEVAQAILEALTEEGVTADTKDTTFRGTYKELTGESLDAAALKAHREALRQFQNADPDATVPAAKNVNKAARKAVKGENMAKPKAAKKTTKKAAAKKEPRQPKAAMTEEERVALANKIIKDRKAEGKKGYENVVRVVTVTDKGRPERVIIRCSEAGCKEEREIAVQDVFQVNTCEEHRNAKVRAYRNELAKKRRAAKAETAPKAAKKAEPKKAAAPKKAAKKATGRGRNRPLPKKKG